MNTLHLPFLNAPPQTQLGLFREWIAEHEQGTPYCIRGMPAWMTLLREGMWECTEELLHVPDLTGVNLNDRDEEGRGWLHYCIYHAAPTTLAQEGLHYLDETWNDPDDFGHTPMQALPAAAVAQSMATRWWGEHQPDTGKTFPQLCQQAQQAGRPDLYRVWSFWA